MEDWRTGFVFPTKSKLYNKRKHGFIVKSTVIIAFFIAFFSISANPALTNKSSIYFTKKTNAAEQAWVDETYASMTQDERIGQLFMIRAHSDKDAQYEADVLNLIKNYHVGGLCFFQGTPTHQAELTNQYQAASKIPLMVSMDAEWGLGMRLKGTTMTFPHQIALGAIKNNEIIYEMGREIGRQCRRLGVHVNFAPVADINNNPNNPVINDRSFGENRENVATKAYSYAHGMQDEKVMACAKHFPGHGDTDVDSHVDLPIIKHSRAHLDEMEFYPFKRLFEQGIGSVMIAHLHVPSLDRRKNRPTTLSQKTIQGVVRDELKYEGLIFTDAMEMKGVTKYFDPGQADVAALYAGNDVILLPENIDASFRAIRHALKTKKLGWETIEKSVKRILLAKKRLGLDEPQQVDLNNLEADLNNPKASILKRQLYEHALTLVRDEQAIIPFRNLSGLKIATLAIGTSSRTDFQKTADLYAPMDHFNVEKNISKAKTAELTNNLSAYDVVLVSFHDLSRYAKKDFGLVSSDLDFIRELAKTKQVVAVNFGNPYALKYFDDLPTVVQAFEEDTDAQDVCAQTIFGANSFKGSLPITASTQSKYGDGLMVYNHMPRLRYDIPERVGMWSDSLAKMDAVVAELIGEGAAPGCQIVVVKNNTVVWNKSYGYQTYLKDRPVLNSDLYDLASVTKVAATTLAVMRMEDEGKMSTDSFMSAYLPELKSSNKARLKVDEMMAHHAALWPWIAFYEKTLNKRKRPAQEFYHNTADTLYDIPVTSSLYMSHDYKDKIWETIVQSNLRSKKTYRYSDLGMYMTKEAVEKVSGKKMNWLMEDAFYKPLGCGTTRFNPWQAGLVDRCAPTEEDRYFRYDRIQGYVHDMGAGMLGGVSGHAGLFSNGNDLAKLFQMLLQKGNYFGHQYISEQSVNKFTTRFSRSTRRGIGFDMKELNGRASQNVSRYASKSTFGHTGFTGTAVWADPENDLIFIFLSNRTYPNMKNNKMFHHDYRLTLQTLAYQAIMPSPNQ